tara:strand:+ start:126 stop:302 length:177 start_codon:yes stop_codon:yes gene_type:complete
VYQSNYSIDLQAYYMQQSMWVDNMVDKYNTSYLYQKRGGITSVSKFHAISGSIIPVIE